VKVRGVNVGSVESITLDDAGHALITMTIDDGVEIARTAQISIEPLSIFGPKFLNVVQGEGENGDDAFAAGETITDTIEAVEFTLVLGDASDLLEAIEPADVATVISTLAEGMGGLGDEFGETIDDLDVLVGIAAEHLPQTRQFLTDLALVSQTLADHSDELLATGRSLHEFLPVVNEHSDDIGALLDDVSQLSNTLGAILDTNADVVDSTLVGLAEVADLLHRRQGDVIDLVNTLDIFFGTLADIIRIPNQPTSPLAGALIGALPEDLCQIFPALPCLLDASAATSAPTGGTTDAAAAPAAAGTDGQLLDFILTMLPTLDPVVLGPLLGALG
jgi:phospholipid/cholesterol/gamma-HCH transport system substrate-binding protein